MANISEFAEQFGQGVRPTLFQVTGTIGTGQQQDFFIKSGQLPASTLGTIEVPYRGRKIKRPGDRTFAEWTITVLASDDLPLRAGFEGWMEQLSSHNEINTTIQLGQEWTVVAQKPDGSPHGTEYTFHNVFPTEVGAMDLNYETVDTIAEFTVTLQYDYWSGGPGDISA
jgi:hypothetical protein|tara:strand:+ start:424 stop:930 length:507 start_codon:yes stop_codon:yes gene_type:complete